MISVQKIYDATRQGLDIILWMFPQAADCVGVKGKKFKVRDEKTPSACLYQRKSEKFGEIWGVTDFGGEGWRSAIQLYMDSLVIKGIIPEADVIRQLKALDWHVLSFEVIASGKWRDKEPGEFLTALRACMAPILAEADG